ncbi:MAG TPA: TonB family protein [Gammaproteobacteria bacterium]|nr:TonB family protein [Gammaproteobacteria bacterium]
MSKTDASAIEQLPKPSGRLSSTLFLTALAHGVVILGITFSNTLDSPPRDSTTLKVSLVTGPADEDVTDAQFLANQSQAGSGTTQDTLRPTTSISTAELMSLEGDRRGSDLRDAREQLPSPAAEALVTSGDADAQIAAQPNATTTAATRPERAAEMINVASEVSRAAELDVRMESPLDESQDPTGPTTLRSILATYLSDWRTRVETIGTANFPREFLAGNRATRRPRLEVAIAPDGALLDIVVEQSSGDRALDEAAVNILRMAAPFDALPAAVEREYGEIRFAYEWDFIRAGAQ